MNLIVFLRRILFVLQGRVVHLSPKNTSRGAVLLSYTTLPFIDLREKILDAHTNRWECRDIAQIFLDFGYSVDIIDFENTSFKPKKQYRYFIDVGTNMERLAPTLGSACTKIYHATGTYWSFQNKAEEERLLNLEKRRGMHLTPRRILPSSRAAEIADVITLIGNDFTESTYRHIQKQIVRIPISTTHTFPSPISKNFEVARNNFIWFGGAGAVHKGLDLVLEAFANMPEYNLTVYGKLESEKDFIDAFNKELFHTKNIQMKGWIDPGSTEFKEVANTSLSIIYPSCSEGTAGSVVLAMHAGLIPIVSKESGVNVEDFGIQLKENTVGTIEETVRSLSAEPESILNKRSLKAWEYANSRHTRKHFDTVYRAFIARLEL